MFKERVAWMYSVEWQKRGPPYTLILVWLIDKLHHNQFDIVIRAEIPDENDSRVKIYRDQTRMVHDLCNLFSPLFLYEKWNVFKNCPPDY